MSKSRWAALAAVTFGSVMFLVIESSAAPVLAPEGTIALPAKVPPTNTSTSSTDTTGTSDQKQKKEKDKDKNPPPPPTDTTATGTQGHI